MADIVIDDISSRVTVGDDWERAKAQHYFNGESIYPPFSCNDRTIGDTGKYGKLSVTFQGTSITFHGNSPPAVCSQTITVSIDGNAPYNTSYDDPTPQTALQWYQSPLLTDSLHTISISRIAGTSVDFMVVKAGLTTPLSGERLIVDDDDTAINYTGKWSRAGGRYTSGDNPNSGLPYRNATHQSNTVGSTATFQFYGTYVSVYSVWDYSLLGAVDVIYKIDSSEYPRTHSVTTDTTQFKDNILQRENVLLFASEPLHAGVHTLTIEVTSSTNNTAMVLDYILYRPSFDTLATMPKLPGISKAPTMLPYTSSALGPTTSTTVPSAGSRATPPVPIGAIVGGILGGIAAFTVLFFIFLRKRIFQRFRQLLSIDHTAPGTEVEPFTTTASAANTCVKQPSAAFRTSNHLHSVSTLNSSGGAAIITADASTARMGQLHDLVAQLEHAISENGEDSSTAAELRQQVANLMTQDTRHLITNIPPPYGSS